MPEPGPKAVKTGKGEKMQVYVENKDGTPLMPCKPAKARHLLRDGNAEVVERTPFTIRLSWDCEGNTQEVRIGVDTGAKKIGYRD